MDLMNFRNYILSSLVFLLAAVANSMIKSSFFDREGFLLLEPSYRIWIVCAEWVFLVIFIVWGVLTLVLAFNELKLIFAKQTKQVKQISVQKQTSINKKTKKK
jgi:hypothetical protein